MHVSDLVGVSYVGLWLVVIVQTLVLLEVLRQLGIIRHRLGDDPGALLVEGEGLERGVPGPGFSAREVRGELMLTQAIFAKGPTLLVFLTTRCQACRELVPQLDRVARGQAGRAQIIAICSGPGDECTALVEELRPSVITLFDRDQAMMRAYNVSRSPSATLVDRDGIVRVHAIANDWRQLNGILDEEVSVSSAEWLRVEQEEEATALVSN